MRDQAYAPSVAEGNHVTTCINPVWPCALTGAVSALSGFDGVAVVIHGSSGCYYYPATLLHRELHSTFLVEQDVVFGAGDRLLNVVSDLSDRYEKIAVVTSCVPAVMGEDIRTLLEGFDAMLVDSPGFLGGFEAGFREAAGLLPIRMMSGLAQVNIEGINLADPFGRGNQREACRLLSSMGIKPGVIFCHDSYNHLMEAPDLSISVNPDLNAVNGTSLGSILGIKEMKSTIQNLACALEGSDPVPAEDEIASVDETIVRVSDKYLKRHDPPSVAIFSTFSYAMFARETLKRYLDAEIVFCGSRSVLPESVPGIEHVTSLSRISEIINNTCPDLVLGSSFEQSLTGNFAFSGLSPPLRGSIRLSSRPIAGTEGLLGFMEDVLNASMDQKKRLKF
ncbi:MAG TPA: nitrogenase component 1 [Methanoregulaceae archaeon]|nr:nitrogenase component 1 [Methanoregulaceae archaeon]